MPPGVRNTSSIHHAPPSMNHKPLIESLNAAAASTESPSSDGTADDSPPHPATTGPATSSTTAPESLSSAITEVTASMATPRPHRSCLKKSNHGDDTDPIVQRRRVSFHCVVVRNYEQTMGDNPSCSIGAPIQLDWDYVEQDPQNINEYESTRAPRRNLRRLVVNYYQRRNLLLLLGHSLEDQKKMEKNMNKTKRQRSVTQFFLPVSGAEAVLASAGRKLKRAVKGRKPQQSNNYTV